MFAHNGYFLPRTIFKLILQHWHWPYHCKIMYCFKCRYFLRDGALIRCDSALKVIKVYLIVLGNIHMLKVFRDLRKKIMLGFMKGIWWGVTRKVVRNIVSFCQMKTFQNKNLKISTAMKWVNLVIRSPYAVITTARKKNIKV